MRLDKNLIDVLRKSSKELSKALLSQLYKQVIYYHGDIILNRSNNSVLLHLIIYRNRQVFDLIRDSGI